MVYEFEGLENVRDLGGFLRIDGAKTRPGLIFRSGRLEKATDGDIQRLASLGITEIIDFRDEAEAARTPDKPVPGAAHHLLPALPRLDRHFRPVNDPTYTPEDIRRDFQRIYLMLAQGPEAAEAYTEFFRILLASEGKPVLFHCTQGKDRAGVAAMLLLTALGIDEDAIMRDYLMTNDYTARILASFEEMDEPPFSMEAAREIFLVYPENLRAYRRCLELEYGSVMNYLELVLGVGPDEIETLERYCLEYD